MVKRIVTFALHQPLFLLLLVALFIASGLVAFKTLPIEAFPDVTDVQVSVITLFPGHAPEEVEKQVTIPIEIALSGVPHAVRLFSHTQFGLSFVILTFNDQASDYFARQQVLERLQGVELPPGVQPGLAPLSTPIGEIYRYRLKGDKTSPTDLRSLQDWVVVRHLKMTPGVADIVSFGGFIKQYQVNLHPDKMHAFHMTLQQVFTALGRGNANAGGSYLERGEQQLLIRGIGLLRSSDDIGNVVLAEHDGTPVLIKHIADVSVSAVPRQGIVGQDDDDEVVSGIVLMRKGENPSEVLTALKERVDILNTSILPKDVQIIPFYDRTWLISTTLTTVFKNLLEGALLVTVVLYLFLGHWRAAGIVAVMIPLSLLATFIGLRIRGIPANLLSLGAMDFGIIVDGAVIVVENIFRKLSDANRVEKTITDERRKHLILHAAVEVGRPTLFSMLIIIAAHIPIFTLQRHEGRIFAPMAYSVVSALIGALILSLTLVPLLSAVMLKKNLPEQENFVVRGAKALYEPALQWALRHARLVLGTAVVCLALSLALLPQLGTEFLPELNEGAVWVNVNYPTSVSVSEAQELSKRVRNALRKFPEVVSVTSKAGRPEDGTDPKLINMAEFLVDLKPENEWQRGVDKPRLLREMDAEVNKIPGITPSFSQPIRDNVLESISQIDGQIVIKVFGDDLDVLRDQSLAVLKQVETVPGVARAFVDRLGELPQIQVRVDRARAARYGLNVSDIQDVIETVLGGKQVTQMWEGEQHFGVAVRLDESERTLVRMQSLLVATSAGAYVPLSEVASFRTVGGLMNIARENGKRVFAIGVFIRGRDMGGVVADMKSRVAQHLKLPQGYSITWSGEFENQERAMARLAIIVPISILVIFLLLFDAFRSFRSSLLIVANIPFSVIGGIVALWITGIYLSVSAAIGFIALFGQSVLNGVVMVALFNELREGGMAPEKAVVSGAITRLRTVLMTALLASLGLLPMALSTGIGAETQKPLAVVVIGGLVSATLLVLFVLPVIYVMLYRREERTTV